VTPTRGFEDASFDDFALSAQALGAAVAFAAPGRVGRTVYRAVAATARVAPSNTNLGMALLFAPLAAAARASRGTDLRRRLTRVLRGLDVNDARWAYRAIRLARPGGLGGSDAEDVRRPPAVTLRHAMALAAARDTVAAEYVRGFAVTFDLALASLRRALGRGLGLLDAIATTHLELMARVPDTLIARKAGATAAVAVARQARAVVRAGGFATAKGLAAARRLDRALRQDGNRLNPGTSADLVAAALFVWLLDASARGRPVGGTRRAPSRRADRPGRRR
jgi:triphosphoribosyl-dephospho-CoA synthase